MTLPHVAKPRSTHWPPRDPARVLIALDQPVLEALIKLTLRHGAYTTRTVTSAKRVGAERLGRVAGSSAADADE